MPYDLYGQYYASSRDATNAEMAQCAAIDIDILKREQRQFEERLHYEQRQPSNQDEEIRNLWEYIKHLEERIQFIESNVNKKNENNKESAN